MHPYDLPPHHRLHHWCITPPIFEGCLPQLRTFVASATAAAAEPTTTTEVAAVAASSSGWGQCKGGRGRGGGGGASTTGGVVAGNAGAGGVATRGGGGSAAKAATVIAATAASVLEPCWERDFLVIVDDYSHYTIVFPLERKADMPGILLTWLVAIRTQRAQLVLRLHSDRGGDFVSVRYAVHQRNLWPLVSRPKVSRTLLWTGSLGATHVFHAYGCLAHFRDPHTYKLSACTLMYLFLGFPLDAPGWLFYHLSSHRFFHSSNITLDDSVFLYTHFPHQGTSAPPPPLILNPTPPPPHSPCPLGPTPPLASLPPHLAPSGVS
ncbi:unnamed protein product [Closterium sp. NIES-54]